MADTQRRDWKIARGYESSDHLQLTLWPSSRQSYLDTRAVEKHLGRLDDDAEARLWRALAAAGRELVDETEVD